MVLDQVLTYLGIAGGVLTILGATVAVTRYLVRFQAQIEEQRLKNELAESRQEAAGLSDRVEILGNLLAEAKRAGQTALYLRQEIDEALYTAKLMLDAEAASILVPYPLSKKEELVFLVVDSPNASKLRRQRIPNRPEDPGIAVAVFHQGRPHLSVDVNRDRQFNPNVDKRSEFRTEGILGLPLKVDGKVIGVVEFLNKAAGSFTNDDIQAASRVLDALAHKVRTFTERPENFELLGLAAESELAEASILFADLSNSSSMMDVFPVPLIVDITNEYLEIVSQVGLAHGATVDKFMGDGFILRFNVPKAIDRHVSVAVETAREMQQEFQRLRSGWIKSGVSAQGVYNRIAVSSGPVCEAFLGPPQYKQQTVIGPPMIVASNMCAMARRDCDVVLIDQRTYDGVSELVEAVPLPTDKFDKAMRLTSCVYEVTRWKDG